MRLRIILALMAIIAFAYPAQACVGGNTQEQLEEAQLSAFERADTDHDGGLTQEEYVAAVLQTQAGQDSAPDSQFDSLDKDEDGRLSLGEWQKGNPLSSFTIDCM